MTDTTTDTAEREDKIDHDATVGQVKTSDDPFIQMVIDHAMQIRIAWFEREVTHNRELDALKDKALTEMAETVTQYQATLVETREQVGQLKHKLHSP